MSSLFSARMPLILCLSVALTGCGGSETPEADTAGTGTEQAAPAGKNSAEQQASQLVEQAIRAGDHSIERVAKTLQTTNRTLQRRLKTEGTTFRTVLNEVRVRLAEDLLLETDLSVAEIAQKLHYSDDKGLRKAIRHVTGKAPSEIRRHNK